MLDILVEGRTYDFGYVYNSWGAFGGSLEEPMKKGSRDFESYYSRKYRVAKKVYQGVVRAFDRV